MTDRRDPATADYVPADIDEHPASLRRLTWGDYAFLGGGIGAIAMILISTVGETHTWQFPVIAALAAVCVIGAIKVRAWE